MQSSIPSFYTLNSGYKCPVMGLGTSDMTNVTDVVYASIKHGARLIDTAARYENEKEIGVAITKAINDNIVKREDLFIITKLSTYEKEDPEKAIKGSMERLNISYIDLYLDHWPSSPKFKNGVSYPAEPMHLYWPKMEELVKKGYAKSIGVCNYNIQSMCNLLSLCSIKPSVLEVEYHPYLYQKTLRDFCRKENIRLIAYNSLCKGPYVEEFFKEENLNLLDEEVLKEMSKNYNKTPGQIALNWSISQGVIVIPRTSSTERMKENLLSTSFKMKDEDIEKIGQLNRNFHFCSSLNWKSFNGIDVFA